MVAGQTVRDICKLGDLAYFGELAKLGEKKRLFRRKTTLSKISPTSAGSFGVAFSSKNESGIAQLF